MDVCLECELCNGFFGDSGRWPRVLGCGHSICTLCTHLLLKNSAIICPKCSTPHPAMTPNMIPLNHTLLKVLGSPFLKNLPNLTNPEDHMKVLTALVSQKLLPGNSGSQEDCRSPEASQVASPSRKKPEVAAEPSHHAGICDEHGQYLLFWCNKCMEWICRDCTLVTHPHSVCPITSIRQKLRDMQIDEDKLIKNTEKHFDENLRLFREKHQVLKEIRSQHRNHVKELQHIISLHRKAERLLEKENAALQEAMSKGLNICFLLLETQGKLLEASSLQDILATRLKAQEYQSAILSWFDSYLLNDSPNLVYSRELQGATEAAFAAMRQKMALSGRSLTERLSQPPLPTSTTTTQSKGAEKVSANVVQDVEKLLFDSSADSDVTGWIVLSPTVLHKGKDEVDEEASDSSDDQDISRIENLSASDSQDKNIDEVRKTGAIKKQSGRFLVKGKRTEGHGNDPNCPTDEMKFISMENLETVSDVEGGPIQSTTLHQIIKESLLPDLHNKLTHIKGKTEISFAVTDIIRHSVSIKQSTVMPKQLLAIKTNTNIENIEEKERTISLVASQEMEDNGTKHLKEKDESDDVTEENTVIKSNKGVLKSTEDVVKIPGTKYSHTSDTKSQDSKIDKTEDLEHTEGSDMKLISAKSYEEINKSKLIQIEKGDSNEFLTGGENSSMSNTMDMVIEGRNRSSNECDEAAGQNADKSPSFPPEADNPRKTREIVEVIESEENSEKDTGRETQDIPDIKKGADICKHQ